MKSLLISRKFNLTIAAVLGAVAGAVSGEMTWSQAIFASIGAIAVNVFGIAYEDAHKTFVVEEPAEVD